MAPPPVKVAVPFASTTRLTLYLIQQLEPVTQLSTKTTSELRTAAKNSAKHAPCSTHSLLRPAVYVQLPSELIDSL